MSDFEVTDYFRWKMAQYGNNMTDRPIDTAGPVSISLPSLQKQEKHGCHLEPTPYATL